MLAHEPRHLRSWLTFNVRHTTKFMTANDRLEKAIALGRTRYILLHGVLVWGVLTAFLVTIWSFYAKQPIAASDIFASFVAFPIGGILYGAFTWSLLKSRYKATRDRAS